jgi:MraZ protein
MFLGEFVHTVDEKGRLTIPAKYRGHLAAGVVITRGIERCLWLYPDGAFKELADQISEPSVTNIEAREFRREVFGGASDVVPDKQGRVILPSYLLKYAHIDNQAVIVGLFDHCEIWNPEDWRQRQERSHNDLTRRAAQFAGLDI